MRAASNDRSGMAQGAAVSLATLIALAILGGVLAHWTWRWFAPAPEPAAPRAAGIGDPQRAASLFGSAPDTVAATTGSAVGIRLLGVVAGADGSGGYAVLQLDGQPIISVKQGGDIAPGLRLAEIAPRSVVLERAGVRESLVLPPPGATVPPITP